MAFDLEGTLAKMAAAALSVLGPDGAKVKDCVERGVQAERDALQRIAAARLAGEIDDADLASQIEDEAGALEAALLACEVKAKAEAQQAVGAALRVFSVAVQDALKIV